MKIGASIFIVDDSLMNNMLFQDILEDAGYHVSVISTSKKAFDKILEYKPDLVILDLAMPEVDGFFVLRQIVKNEKTKNIPVMMVTADTTEDSMKKAYEIGALDYLTKPVYAEVLINHIEKILVKN